MPIIEEGWADTEVAHLTAKEYLKELLEQDIDSLVLGCTHYPILKRTIGDIVGEKIKLVNPAKETAKDLSMVLEQENILRGEGKVSYEYYVSDIPERFISIGQQFIKRDMEDVKKIDIQKY